MSIYGTVRAIYWGVKIAKKVAKAKDTKNSKKVGGMGATSGAGFIATGKGTGNLDQTDCWGTGDLLDGITDLLPL